MEPSHAFMKARAVALSCILLTSLLWVLLLCLVAFFRWDVSPPLERSLVVILLCTNAITVIMVPLLLILKFRVWLDIARILLLLVLHIGSAAAFTYCNTYFACTKNTVDEEGICRLINIYILLASWVNPGLLLAYGAGLGYMLYRHSQIAKRDSQAKDEEASVATQPMAEQKAFRAVVPVYGRYPPPSEHPSLTPWLGSDEDSQGTTSTSSGHMSKPQHASWTHAL